MALHLRITIWLIVILAPSFWLAVLLAAEPSVSDLLLPDDPFWKLLEEAVSAHRSSEKNLRELKLVEALSSAKKSVDLHVELLGEMSAATAAARRQLGLASLELRDYPSARLQFERVLAIRRALLGPKHHDVAVSYFDLGRSRDNHRTYEVGVLFDQGLAIYSKLFGPDHPETIRARRLRWSDMGMLTDTYARTEFETLLRYVIEQNGAKHPAVAGVYDEMAFSLLRSREYSQALSYFEKALAIRTELFGADDLQTAASYESLGRLRQAQKDYAGAQSNFETALRIRTKALGEQSPERARTLELLADCMFEKGNFGGARAEYERAVAVRKAALGDNHFTLIEPLRQISKIDMRAGKGGLSNPIERQCVELMKSHDLRDLDTLHREEETAIRAAETRFFSSAQLSLEGILKRRINLLGEFHPDVVATREQLGMLALVQLDLRAARHHLERAIEVRGQLDRGFSLRLGVAHNQLGVLQQWQGDAVGARRSFELATSIFAGIRAENRDEADLARALAQAFSVASVNLLSMRPVAGPPRIVDTAYDQLTIDQPRNAGERQRKLAASIDDLGVAFHAAGDIAHAQACYRKALDNRLHDLGELHPDAGVSQMNLGLLAASQGQWNEAERHIDAARRNFRFFQASMMPLLVEFRQLAIARTDDEFALPAALSMSLARPDQSSIHELTAACVLNGKATNVEEMSGAARWARNSMFVQFEEVVQTRRKLTNNALTGTAADSTVTIPEALRNFADVQAMLARAIAGRATGMKEPVRAHPWIEIHEVRSRIPEGSILIEIARFRPCELRLAGQLPLTFNSPRYAAWIIPAAGWGDIRFVDLGPAEPIEKAIIACRSALHQAPHEIEKLDVEGAHKRTQAALSALGELVLQPLLPMIGSARRWIVSPDDALWLVPWQTLPVNQGVFAIERHSISYAVSGRHFVTAHRTGQHNGTSLIYYDPDYDGTNSVHLPPEVLSYANTLQYTDARRDPFASALGDPNLHWKRGDGLSDPAVGMEHGLWKYLGTSAYGFSGREMTEATCRKILSPRVLVLSAATFFNTESAAAAPPSLQATRLLPWGKLDWPELKEQPFERGAIGFSNRSSGYRLVNPLLECGLAITGANRSFAVRDDHADDGLLTGLEICDLKLRGCELVVLPAFHEASENSNQGVTTGGVELRSAAKATTLRHAFIMAGAYAVLDARWKTPLQQTKQILNGFWSGLADGQSHSEALRMAQLKAIEDLKMAHGGVAHPYFWAGLALTGPGP